MRRLLFCPIFLGVLALNVSCLKSLETETTPQAAITSFVVGYYNVKFHDINYHRRDTIINVREGGVMYPMTIDQINNRIYNVDSLAYGSQVRAVTTSVSATGTVFYKYNDGIDSTEYLWSSTDSINFTRPLVFGALSTDGKYKRLYNVELNIRNVFPDSVHWSMSYGTGYTGLDNPCATILNDTLYNMGLDPEGNLKVECRNIGSGNWTAATQVNGVPASGWAGVLVPFSGRLYSQWGTAVYGSSNGTDWTEIKSGIRCLVQTSLAEGALWAVDTDGKILSTVDMAEWKEWGQAPAGFPDSAAVALSYPLETNPSITRTVLVGLGTGDEYASVWTTLSTDSVWSQVDMPADTELRLPSLGNRAIIRYDGSLFAFGAGLKDFRQSNDNGVTWYVCDSYAEDYSSWNRYMQFPVGLKGYNGSFSYAVDRLGAIWINTSRGQVWRGAITRLDKRGK